MEIAPFTPADYEAACALWAGMEGISLSDADSRAAIARFLERNPGTCFAAREGGRLVGTLLAGSDGRRFRNAGRRPRPGRCGRTSCPACPGR